MRVQGLDELREAAGLTVEELARLAHVSRKYLRDVEAGYAVPGKGFCWRVAGVLSRVLGRRRVALFGEVMVRTDPKLAARTRPQDLG